MTKARITALGVYAPEKVVDNNYFTSFLDTNDEWIQTRTGIKTRRYSGPEEFTSDLCIGAAKNLIEQNGADLKDVDFIIVATITGDHTVPSVASQLQTKLGIESAGSVDIAGACAGFIYAIILAQGLVSSGMYKKVLVFGAECLTKFTDFTDRTSCILFGDGAGAALIEASETSNIIQTIAGTDGTGGKELYLSNLRDNINDAPVKVNNKIVQNGRAVFKWAVQTVTAKIAELTQNAGITVDDIDWLVPHSANMRILESISQGSKIPMEKILESVSDYGNTSSASIPLALAKGIKEGKVKKGDKLLMIGFGGGLTYAGMIIEW